MSRNVKKTARMPAMKFPKLQKRLRDGESSNNKRPGCETASGLNEVFGLRVYSTAVIVISVKHRKFLSTYLSI